MTRIRSEMGGLRGLGLELPFIRPETERESRPMSKREFREALLQIMEKKSHWADPAFPALVSNEAMLTRFQREYWDFVKPFPYYLRGVLAQLPAIEKGKRDRFKKIRKDLKENIEEEETGEHHAGESHADLFLLMPKDPAFGFTDEDFKMPPTAPQSVAYRDFLTDASYNRGWEIGAAITTLFLEGNRHERSNFHDEFGIEPWRGLPLEEHPLRVHKKLQLRSLKLVKVHHDLDAAEGDHRKAAWNMILNGIPPSKRREVVLAMREALERYQAWRDEEAGLCGLRRDEIGNIVSADFESDRGV